MLDRDADVNMSPLPLAEPLLDENDQRCVQKNIFTRRTHDGERWTRDARAVDARTMRPTFEFEIVAGAGNRFARVCARANGVGAVMGSRTIGRISLGVFVRADARTTRGEDGGAKR